MKQATVELSTPIADFFGKTVKRIVLREPNYRMYAARGEPHAYSRTADGAYFSTVRDDVVAAYIEDCIIEPSADDGGMAILAHIANVKDARAVRGALLGFFTDTDAATSEVAPV